MATARISPNIAQADWSVMAMKGAAVLVPVVGVILTLWQKPIKNVSFPDLPTENVVGLLTGLVVIALFIERAVEVLLAPLRHTTCLIIKENVKSERAILPKEKASELLDIERELMDFKGQTRRIASLMGLALGIAISASGVRGLASLLHLNMNECCSLFKALDVVLTGALLAGGADGLHRIAAVVSSGYKGKQDDENKSYKQPTST